jgi:hypothetical protein
MRARRRQDDEERPDEAGESAPADEPELLDSGTVSALREADPHTRARTLLRLQRQHGNAAVERVIRSLQVTEASRDARVQALGERALEPAQRLDRAQLYRDAVAAELDASPYASKTERELVQDNVNTVGQIFSNYQAALHLLEEAVVSGYGEAVPRALALEVLREAAHEVFTPVLDACVGVAPGFEELVAESLGAVDEVRDVERPEPGQSAPAHALRNLVVAERGRVAATHSRLIRRQVAFMAAAESRAAVDLTEYRRALVAAAGRLDELETGSHSAGALFRVLFDRWRELVRARLAVRIVLDERWKVLRAHIEGTGGQALARQLLADGGGVFDLGALHLARHVVWQPAELAVCQATVDPDGRTGPIDRNERAAPFADEFERRLRTEPLPPTRVLSGD